MSQKIVVEIPNYIRRVKVSEQQRAKLFEVVGGTLKGGSSIDKFLKPQYKGKRSLVFDPIFLIEGYTIRYSYKGEVYKNYQDYVFKVKKPNTQETFSFRARKYLYDINKQDFVIANPTKVGKPRFEMIRGQGIYSGDITPFLRREIMSKIKDTLYEYIKDLPVINDDWYPVRITCQLHDSLVDKEIEKAVKPNWDLDNRLFPYKKAFPDVLQSCNKIRNDSVPFLTKIDEEFVISDEPKLVFIIEPDRRDEILNNPYYKDRINLLSYKEIKINENKVVVIDEPDNSAIEL